MSKQFLVTQHWLGGSTMEAVTANRSWTFETQNEAESFVDFLYNKIQSASNSDEFEDVYFEVLEINPVLTSYTFDELFDKLLKDDTVYLQELFFSVPPAPAVNPLQARAQAVENAYKTAGNCSGCTGAVQGSHLHPPVWAMEIDEALLVEYEKAVGII